MSNMRQTTNSILMIAPVAFGSNPDTLADNAFQQKGEDGNSQQVLAREEFDNLRSAMFQLDVDIFAVEDTPQPWTPDSIFPNNWVSFHEDGTVVLYPMKAPNRRLERRQDIIKALAHRFLIKRVIDLTYLEKEGKFLEGTGSLVLDHIHRTAYACLSQRTDQVALQQFCHETGYAPVSFHATDSKGMPIYHTNVMMSIGECFAVICASSIADGKERQQVVERLTSSGREVIEISHAQMNSFAGNMLEVTAAKGEGMIVMSNTAFESLTDDQILRLEERAPFLHQDIATIEKFGGGGARCMLAEIFLPTKA